MELSDILCGQIEDPRSIGEKFQAETINVEEYRTPLQTGPPEDYIGTFQPEEAQGYSESCLKHS